MCLRINFVACLLHTIQLRILQFPKGLVYTALKIVSLKAHLLLYVFCFVFFN